MTDIFFSYSGKDRARVQAIHDALVNRGFLVFWDQEVPTGIDWDDWIRKHLTDSKCAIVLWSGNSILSHNVRHEAVIARDQSKIIPVLIDEISADRFPMGLYTMQAANLASWDGDLDADEWVKLLKQIESKLIPAWIRPTLDALEAELVGERSRRETAERRDKTLRVQIAKEAEARQQLRSELDNALDEVSELKKRCEVAEVERMSAQSRMQDLTRQLEIAHTPSASPPIRAEQRNDGVQPARPPVATVVDEGKPAASRARAADASPMQVSPIAAKDTAVESSNSPVDERWQAWEGRSSSPQISPFLIVAAVFIALIAVWMIAVAKG